MTEGADQTDSGDNTAVRSFQAGFPDAELTELRRRISATRWPERETVNDDSQGARLAIMQDLARYWETGYDWRKCEAKLNALPNFITEIDGLDIHFIHVRSQHEDALPLIVTHGWPGSIIEQLKIIGPLTDPTTHGASAADAFHLVIPSLPGHGFSAKPATTGWDPVRIARAWVVLMKRLGYTRFRARPASHAGTHGRRPYARRPSRQHHAVLADEHRGFGGPAVLGKQGGLLQRQEHFHSVCHQRLSRRALPGPRSWAERAYPHNLIYYNKLDRGGHFAAWEQPDLFCAEMRASFRSLR
jgi:pimeloyl-ACP methyl ester carboxylesterase